MMRQSRTRRALSTRTMRSSTIGFFANGLRENLVCGVKVISAPSLPGLNNRKVIRGGLVLVEALTFMMLVNGTRSCSSP